MKRKKKEGWVQWVGPVGDRSRGAASKKFFPQPEPLKNILAPQHLMGTLQYNVKKVVLALS
jgi:hypothetical protein